MNKRRYDIDWLRMIVMMAVFLFHSARFFTGIPWHLTNPESSIVALSFTGVLDMWFMPLFFLLSGAGSWYALKSRTGGQYVVERVKRILIPLYTVGLFLLLPPQFFFEIFQNAGFTGTFWESLPLYFQRLGYVSPLRPDYVLPFSFGGHLWFLQYLFLISLVTLPVMLYLRSEKGARFIDRLADWCIKRGGIFLFIIPLVVIRIGLRSVFLGGNSWSDFIEYAFFFLIGYILPADARITESIKRYGTLCLILGILGFAGEGTFLMAFGYNYPAGEPFGMQFILFQIIMSIGRWSWIVFVLSLGAKYLTTNTKLLSYGNEAVLPFYIFHQTIILCVGWFVIPWDRGILPKYVIITVASFFIIIGLYEALVRHLNPMRFVFGMRLKKR